MVVGLSKPFFHHFEVFAAQFKLPCVQFHYWVEKQGQLSFHAIVAQWRGELNELGGYIYHFHPEIFRRAYAFNQLSLAYNHQVARLQLSFLTVVFQLTTASQAKCMGQVIAISISAKSIKAVLYYDVIGFCHVSNTLISFAKIHISGR